jgi:hypothetical protein
MSRAATTVSLLITMSAAGTTRPGLGAAPQEAAPAVIVQYDSTSAQTTFEIIAGDCRIAWTTFASEPDRGVIRHRADCTLPLREQAPLLAKLLRAALSAGSDANGFRSLDWGRIYPDGARDATLAVQLALAAKRSPEWDAARGAPRRGDLNAWVKKRANETSFHADVLPVFRASGLHIRLSSVEKVLVLPAGKLPFYGSLRRQGVQAEDRLPFDFQAWFSIEPGQR